MLTALLTIQIIVTVVMIATILMQPNSNDGMGGLGGGGQPSLAVDHTSFLSKLTGILAAIFMANSLAMAIVSSSSVSREDKMIQKLQDTRLPNDATPKKEAVSPPEKSSENQKNSPASAPAATAPANVSPAEAPASEATPAETPTPAPTEPKNTGGEETRLPDDSAQ